MRFQSKPVIIEATQWFKNGDHPKDECRLIVPVPGDGEPFLSEGKIVRYFRHPGVPGDSLCIHCDIRMHEHGWIDTREGDFRVCPGDWIITGLIGEYYACKPKVFEMKYYRIDS